MQNLLTNENIQLLILVMPANYIWHATVFKVVVHEGFTHFQYVEESNLVVSEIA